MMNKKLKMLFIFTILFLLLECSNDKYSNLLEMETQKHFSNVVDNFITKIEWDQLYQEKDDYIFLGKLLNILKNKRFLPTLDAKDKKDYVDKITLEKALQYIIKRSYRNKTNVENYFKILITLNKNITVGYCYSLITGLYTSYLQDYDTFKSFLEKQTINDFIDSLPNIKQAFLSIYFMQLKLKQKVDERIFYTSYSKIDEKNYANIFKNEYKNFDNFMYDEKTYIKNVASYYELLKNKME